MADDQIASVYLSRLANLSIKYKDVLCRLADNTSFSTAKCLPGYDQTDPNYKDLRNMECTHEYNMRVEFACSLGVHLGKAFHSCYMDPGTEEILASFLLSSQSLKESNHCGDKLLPS
jgi:hypothetical protein